MEIERKWRLAGPPPAEVLAQALREELRQGYLVAEPGELRLRSALRSGRCFLTVKGDGSISREEWEVEAPNWVFHQLWPATLGRRVAKTRYRIQHGPLLLEVDVYHENLAGLVILECEFRSEAAAGEFLLPGWAASAREVTADPAYKNKALALRGLPQ